MPSALWSTRWVRPCGIIADEGTIAAARSAPVVAGEPRTATYNSLSHRTRLLPRASSELARYRRTRVRALRAPALSRATVCGKEGARLGADRLGRRAGARAVRDGRSGAPRADRHRLRRSPRGAASRRGDRMVRARPARRDASRLGDSALRPLLAASGSRLRAPRDALPRGAWRV